MKRGSVLILLALLYPAITWSQLKVSIPAYTAYALPAEESSEDDESTMFSVKDGLHNWTDIKRQVEFYFKIRNAGTLTLSLKLRTNIRIGNLTASIAGKDFTVVVPESSEFRLVKIGSVNIKDTGFHKLTLYQTRENIIANKKAMVRSTIPVIADIQSLELSGTAVRNIHFNTKPRRNAASVHLFYPLPDSVKAISFYNEITVPEGADVLHSYYMACGFSRGYFGIQVNSATERRVIFSVWDAGNEAVDRKKVADENKVQLIAKGEEVFAGDFGNEGTGGHSHWVYNWKAGETYKFLVTAITDTAANTTTYTGYIFLPEIQKWKLIAAFKAPKDGKPLRKLYSFVENFWGTNGQLSRKAYFGNQWIRKENGEWKELTNSTFSFDATGKAGDRIDQGGGAEGNRFYLWNGGFKNADVQFNDAFSRTENGEKPVIDLYKNADSLAESEKENQLILAAIREGKFDTTGSNNGVYYKILEEGKGDYVTLNDTLIVRYKGQLLNGFIFDQTKEKPAVFPLKRLIKGWQTGLPYCRQGGKIRLLIPSPYAYTIRNLGTIPPNSILVFDIEVVDIRRSH